jgi:long-chain acyl-CoA synthetase
MVGYRNQPQETANMIRDGWLYTGDIGELDEDGYVYIRDRKKDMVIVSGYNVYPREIDEVLFAHPDVLEAVTVGLPDPYRGETIGVCVALKSDSSIDAAALLDHCQQNLTAYKVPTIIHFMPEIPKTAAGKIDRRAARSIILDATAAKAQGADQ